MVVALGVGGVVVLNISWDISGGEVWRNKAEGERRVGKKRAELPRARTVRSAVLDL